MSFLVDRPLLLFVGVLVVQGLGAYAGDFLRRRGWGPAPANHEHFNTIQTATLTLLALIIAFTFSMAVSRYDQRKTYEEEEANAIGTEYFRTDLLPPSDAGRVRDLLRNYLDRRIQFYQTRDERHLAEVNGETGKLQAELWAAILPAARSQPTPLSALVVSGMNDVLNSQGYTQAAWWNRIPVTAWILMIVIAVASNILIGSSEHRGGSPLLAIMPVLIAISFFLIADIDSPRFGPIRTLPQNLIAVAEAIGAH